MTEPTATAEDFDIKVEDAGPARKRISVLVPSKAIDKRMGASLGSLQSEAVLPGFRKGKAPKHLLERRFGSAMKDETIQTLVREGYEKAVEDSNLDVLGDAEIDGGKESLTLEDGKPFAYTLEVDIIPEFEFPEFENFKIIRPELEVTEPHIDDEIGRQCLRAGKAERVEDGFRSQDRMLGAINIEAADEETPLFVHDQALVVMPAAGEPGQVLGLLIDDLYSFFKTARVGDTITLKATGPDAHEREDFRGKALTITYMIHLCERVTPTTPEELIEQFSLGSTEVLREQIRLALEQRRDEEQASVLRRQAVDQITEAISFELPERASGVEVQRQLDRMRHDLTASGELSTEEVEMKLTEIRGDAEEGTRLRMKSYFILQRLARHFKVQVSEQEINSRIASMAMQRGLRPDHVRTELAKAGQLSTIASQVLDDKAADAMVAQMSISDMPADEWNAMHEAGDSAPVRKKAAKKSTSKKAASKKTTSKKAPAKKAASKKTTTKKAATKKSASKKSST